MKEEQDIYLNEGKEQMKNKVINLIKERIDLINDLFQPLPPCEMEKALMLEGIINEVKEI